MDVALLGLAVSAAILAAYHAGKAAERSQVQKFLRRAHSVGWRDATPLQLAAMISTGQHYDLGEDA